MTRFEYYVASLELILVKFRLKIMPEETREYYIPKLKELAKNYAFSLNYYESRIGFKLYRLILLDL